MWKAQPFANGWPNGAAASKPGKILITVDAHGHAYVTNVEWVSSYAILGPYDYLDVFRAPNVDAACKVSTLVRSGYAAPF